MSVLAVDVDKGLATLIELLLVISQGQVGKDKWARLSE